MFDGSMSYRTMDEILKEMEGSNKTLAELLEAGHISVKDAELFLKKYMEEFELEEKDLIDKSIVGDSVFFLSSKLQSMKSDEFFE